VWALGVVFVLVLELVVVLASLLVTVLEKE
jgi:hypothetical protein